MAKIRAFRAIRPVRDKAHLIASRSYVTYSSQDLKEKLNGNPYTYLHIINPEEDPQKKSPLGSKEFLKKVKGKFNEFRDKGYFLKEKNPCLYIYEQIHHNHSYHGIIGCASIDDYLDGSIKKHEATLEKREKKLKQYLDVVDINAEPVCFSYEDNKDIESIIAKYRQQRPEYEFATTDEVVHKLWVVSAEQDLKGITGAFEDIEALYIADGHHRTASSARFGSDKRKQKGNFSGDEPFNYFMGFFIPESELKVYGFHRLIKDLNGMSKEEFMERLLKDFELEQLDPAFAKPEQKNQIHLYFGHDEWFRLIPKAHVKKEDKKVSCLDAFIVSEYILAPILDIRDLRRDKRVKFVGGENGILELKEKVDSGAFKLGIGLFPVPTEDLKSVADAGEVMPPKSTYIEPKLRSGLTIYSLSEK